MCEVYVFCEKDGQVAFIIAAVAKPFSVCFRFVKKLLARWPGRPGDGGDLLVIKSYLSFNDVAILHPNFIGNVTASGTRLIQISYCQ